MTLYTKTYTKATRKYGTIVYTGSCRLFTINNMKLFPGSLGAWSQTPISSSGPLGTYDPALEAVSHAFNGLPRDESRTALALLWGRCAP